MYLSFTVWPHGEGPGNKSLEIASSRIKSTIIVLACIYTILPLNFADTCRDEGAWCPLSAMGLMACEEESETALLTHSPPHRLAYLSLLGPRPTNKGQPIPIAPTAHPSPPLFDKQIACSMGAPGA